MSQTTTSTQSKTTVIVGDQSLDVAHLDEIRLESLIAKDQLEMAKLLKAAESKGFFYLTFNDDLAARVASHLQTSYQNQHEYFAKSSEEKMKAFHEGSIQGYKCAGIESFEIPRDEQNRMTLPSPFAENAESIIDLANICNTAVRTVLHALCDSLGLGEASSLENAHNPEGKSDSGIKFVSGPTKVFLADVPDTTHTDGGSITLLWCEKWATQIRTKDTKEWLWVDPKPNRVLVNVADYVQNQTGGRLHSPYHRVSQPSDGAGDRYFVSYFLRPNH